MANDLQVVLATISRFHSFDMAAQLERYRVLAAIYTGLARRFVRTAAVAPRHIRPFPWLQTPLEAYQRLGMISGRRAEVAGWHARQALDRHVARTLPPCHVYCALSGIGLISGAVAQERGAAFVCHRSSTHIVHQDWVLRREHHGLALPYAGIDPRVIEKECAEYEAADAILVPSGFVRRSFIDQGVAPERLITIPFGVDLDSFRRCAPRDDRFRILFVGQLSVRKGLHDLLRAVRLADLKRATLVLVGAEQPETKTLLARFPVKSVEITGPLSRAAVAEQMSRAGVFVLPSVEEGLALVMAEALACGCPVIASENTGAADLFNDGDEGIILPAGDVEGIARGLTRLYDDPALRDGMGKKGETRMRALGGWDRFGKELVKQFERLARAAGHDVAVPGPADLAA